MCLNDRWSSYLYNNVDFLPGAIHSPFLFSLHADSLTSWHSSLLKNADDIVFGNSYSKCSDQDGLGDDLSRLATWSSDHGLNISKTKCVECLVYSKNTSSQLLFSFLNREVISHEQSVKYLGVHFFSNMTLSTHIDTVFTKCLKLSFLFAGSVQ